MAQSRIPPSELRWRVDPRRLESRRESAVPLQDALDSLTSALKRSLTASEPRRSHLFVRGETASRRHELLHEAIESLSVPRRDQYDFCFVHNFDRPDRPRLIRLPAGSGRKLRAQLREAACFIRDELETALNSRPIRNRVEALRDRSAAEMDRLTKPLEKRLKPHGLVLVREEVGQMVRLTVHVQQTGRTITQDDLANLVAKGQVGQDEFEQIRQVVRDVQPELRRITEEINRTWKHAHQLRGKLLRAETRRFVAGIAQPVLEKFDAPDIKKHLENIVADVVEKRVDRPLEHLADPELIYGTNLVHSASRDRLPVVHEQVPTTRNLGGTIDPGWLADRRSVASFQGIRGGSLVAAGNGLLIIDAEDLLARSDSVRLLRNVLSGTSLPIEPPGSSSMSPAISLRPDPVPIGARLVLIGTPKHWNRLARRFPAFAELFAPPVDVPATIARDDAGIAWLADQVDYLARTEGAKLSKEAVAALIEHAARLGGAQRLSTRLGEFRRLLRQAKAEAADEGEDHVTAVHVHDAVDRLLPTRPADAGADATRLRFPGRQPQPGQVHACGLELEGDLAFGQLIRVQAAVAADRDMRIVFEGTRTRDRATEIRVQATLAGVLGIDRMIGIHAFIGCAGVPGGNPRSQGPGTLLGTVVALLSRLADVPLRQDLALIGQLESDGRLTAVSGINERIEDAFAVAQRDSARGNAGVIVPAVQREGLMLRPELIKAVGNDLFQVLVAGNLAQVLELLIGTSPGTWRDGRFTPDSLFDRARNRLLADAD